ncbi:hypothetical protein [Myxococcus sp. CA039A]|uniref:hypothetical protein n=1 Tax=Myxococcus sp. CA039A TaxID=2741737 RepID=UPI00157B24F5|nr:hypothetical protein [Myxococcus sp. CA039A]NTX53301.1 hypothetical protein [Myxococcus sp. CA039A]
MALRDVFLSLALSLSAPALAQEGVTVSVRCTETCTVVFDGKRGRRVNEALWEFQGIAPGARRVEATGVLGRPLASGFADIPDTALATVYLVSNQRIVVRKESTSSPGTPEWVEGSSRVARVSERTPSPPPPPPSTAKSVAIVRCLEDCAVMLDGQRGTRRDERTWEFRNVEPGKRRVEGTAELLQRKLFASYIDVPAGTEARYQGDSKGRVILTEHWALADVEEAREKAGLADASRLHVRCLKSCEVSLDGARKGDEGGSGGVIQDVKPGRRELKVMFTLGKQQRRLTLDVPARSEVFITASEGGGLQVTNTKPLGAE